MPRPDVKIVRENTAYIRFEVTIPHSALEAMIQWKNPVARAKARTNMGRHVETLGFGG